MVTLMIASLVLAGFGCWLLLQLGSKARQQVSTQIVQLGTLNTDADRRRRSLDGSLGSRVWAPIARILARLATGLTPNSMRSDLDLRLLKADVWIGARHFLILKGTLGLSGFAIGLLLGLANYGPAKSLLFGLLLGSTGFMGADMWLTLRQRARSAKLEAELPDILDMLSISVTAGLSFDGAILKLAERMKGPVVDDLTLALRNIQLGESRRTAILAMGHRTASESLSTFARAVIQSDELGVSLGRTLREQASELRTHRQLQAEERAMRAPVKLLFPTVIFIFPVMFMVVLMPAGMRLAQLFESL